MTEKSKFPRLLRGFIIKCQQQKGGGYSGLISDMAGNQYQLAPAHWLEPELNPTVGRLVEFVPGIVEKGRLAKHIRAITADTLLTDEADEEWAELALEEHRSYKRRVSFNRISHLVCEQNYPIERAICEVYDIDLPSDVTYPNEPTDEDKIFVTLDLGPSRKPKKTNPVTKRLCDNFSLDLPRLLGFVRGSISYRTALELCLNERRRSMKECRTEIREDTASVQDQDKAGTVDEEKRSWLGKFINR